MDDHLVAVHVAHGGAEEDQVRSFLEAHGIPTWVRGEALRRTHGLTLDGLGMVQILVREADVEAARELLGAVERGELALADDSDSE